MCDRRCEGGTEKGRAGEGGREGGRRVKERPSGPGRMWLMGGDGRPTVPL